MSTSTVEIPKAHGIPVWVTLLVVLVSLTGGGYLAYYFLMGAGQDQVILLRRPADERIQQARNPNVWLVATNNEQLSINMTDPAKPRLNFQIFRHDLTHEQNVLLWVGANQQIANQLGITPDQRIKLRALTNAAHVEPARPTMDAMRDEFLLWFKTPAGPAKDDIEDKMFTMLDQATKGIDDQSKAAVFAKAQKVRLILTPDQLQQVSKIRLPWQ